MKTAVIYARYSSDKQTEQSIEGQLRICNDYAQRNDIVIVDTYIDRAMTGTNDNRTAFQKMLKDSNKRAWDIVLVYKLDRFSRNKYEMAMHKKTLRDNGIKVVSAMENIPDTPEGIILESLLEGMAEYYSAELAQKVSRGLNESRQKGLFTGGNVSYGYRVEKKKVYIHEERAEIVKYIFEEYAKGAIAKDIINELTSRGVLHNGKPFRYSTFYKMLTNEKYIGIYRYKDEVFTNTYPQIVPNSIFELVQSRLMENKQGKNSVKIEYLLRKKMKCGYCNHLIIGESGTSKSGKTKAYYKCGTKKAGNPCQKTQMRKDEIENLVIKTTLKVFNNNETLSYIADKIVDLHKQNQELQSTLNILLKSKKEIETAIENIISAIEKGIVSNSTNKRLHDLEEQLNGIENRIAIEKTKTGVELHKSEIIKFIKTALKQEPKQMLDLLIKEIILYNDKIDIIYNFTNDQNPDNPSQDFLFHNENIEIKSINPDNTKVVFDNLEMSLFI